ncbi:hypothetical protein U1Q18_009333, partial [Sarracenia purpurea var. burkii]
VLLGIFDRRVELQSQKSGVLLQGSGIRSFETTEEEEELWRREIEMVSRRRRNLEEF